ncbi:hypothetical protein VP01_658g6 [Puccinia sorghi]|uniref:Major facilitator superfamily (MFS) profile domain-containing protein n=1 Tax=Puccinia sorghi TaxID=27349 RepID=A0A0L6UG40_9BASI|nr:hypothetical protein VP01_658g6 [Puccinia sorghi]
MTLRIKQDRPLGAEPIEESFSWYQVCCAIKSPHVLLAIGALFMVGSNLYGLAYFEPSIVKTVSFSYLHRDSRSPSPGKLTPLNPKFGYSARMTQLVSVPPFAVGFFAMLSSAYFSDRYEARGITAVTTSLIAFTGYLIFLLSDSNTCRYLSLFLSTAGIYSASPTLYAWLANNSAPQYRKATAIALGPVFANTGGILSTWLFPSSEQPHYQTATIVNLCFSAGIVLLCSVNYVWLRYCNKKKELPQEEEPKILPEKGPPSRTILDNQEWLRLGDRHKNFRYAY